MELKFLKLFQMLPPVFPFNRTAYGIEISHPQSSNRAIRTFNRTAYGIEIAKMGHPR